MNYSNETCVKIERATSEVTSLEKEYVM